MTKRKVPKPDIKSLKAFASIEYSLRHLPVSSSYLVCKTFPGSRMMETTITNKI